jgi:3-hydroxybutyryl-CoA dehydrogenase
MHFSNPVPVLKLVEIVPSLLTSERTGSALMTSPPTCWADDDPPKDRVIHRELAPGAHILSAVRMLIPRSPRRDIDNGMMLGRAHLM